MSQNSQRLSWTREKWTTSSSIMANIHANALAEYSQSFTNFVTGANIAGCQGG
ncbi:MAG: hypothetical protein ACLSUW_07015 [Akkermansia sp.]